MLISIVVVIIVVIVLAVFYVFSYIQSITLFLFLSSIAFNFCIPGTIRIICIVCAASTVIIISSEITSTGIFVIVLVP